MNRIHVLLLTIVLGWTSVDFEGDDAWVLKLDDQGGLVWDATYGDDRAQGAAAVVLTDDGGYVVAAGTNSNPLTGNDAWIFGLDADGGLVRQVTLGGPKNDGLADIQHAGDGGFILTGSTQPEAGSLQRPWVVKLKASCP